MEHLDIFLARCPPFDGVAAQQVRDLAAAAEIRALAADETALVEDGPPAGGLWVILTGSMGLVHQNEVVQVLGPGECFGHASLLTGMAPMFSVRAREPTRCAVLPARAARTLLATEAGVTYVARTLRRRLTRTGHTVHGLQDVGTTPVSAIMRPPVFMSDEATLADAARAFGQPGVSALLVVVREGAGPGVAVPPGLLAILTDADIRRRVGQADFSPDAPARGAARAPVRTVPATQLAIEATVDMVSAGVEHLAVVDGGRVCGVVCAADLLGLDARSPIGVRHTILEAADEEALIRAVAMLPRQFLALAGAGVPARDLGRVLSLAQDAAVARLIEFSIWRRGPAPASWAWLDLGSAARREFTLASDQDNALAYDRAPAGEAAVDGWFAELGSDVNGGLARCGIGADNNGVMAGSRRWRMSKSEWLHTFDSCLTEPNESQLVRATVAFDFRPTSGGLPVAAELSARIRRARDHPQFMRLIARSAAGWPVALGFRGQLSTDDSGRLDLKRGAITPLVNVVRYYALAAGVTISSTLDRLAAVGGAGALDEEPADALREAFDVITRTRFEHHAECIAAGRPADNLIDPGALAPIARADLRAALHTVRRAQRRLPA